MLFTAQVPCTVHSPRGVLAETMKAGFAGASRRRPEVIKKKNNQSVTARIDPVVFSAIDRAVAVAPHRD